MKKLYFYTISGLIAMLIIVALPGCQTNRMPEEAAKDLKNRDYHAAMQKLLRLSPKTLLENDSLILMLSEAYYGATSEYMGIDAESICDMDIYPDGKTIAFTDLHNGEIMEYSFPEMEYKRTIEAGSPCYGIDISPDGTQIAAALSTGEVSIINASTGKPVRSLRGHINRARGVVYLDSIHLVSGSTDQRIIAWNLQQNKSLDSKWRHRKAVKRLRKSKDGKYVVSASNDGTAIVWNFADLEEAKELKKVVHGRNYVNDAMLSPDNQILVTVSGDYDAKIWNAKSGKLIQTIEIRDCPTSIDFSPDGKYIVIGGTYFAHLIDTGSWKVIRRYPIENEPVWSIRFVDNKKFVFADSSHFFEAEIISGEELIKAAQVWKDAHK